LYLILLLGLELSSIGSPGSLFVIRRSDGEAPCHECRDTERVAWLEFPPDRPELYACGLNVTMVRGVIRRHLATITATHASLDT
jgi:hypothetical protein